MDKNTEIKEQEPESFKPPVYRIYSLKAYCFSALFLVFFILFVGLLLSFDIWAILDIVSTVRAKTTVSIIDVFALALLSFSLLILLGVAIYLTRIFFVGINKGFFRIFYYSWYYHIYRSQPKSKKIEK